MEVLLYFFNLVRRDIKLNQIPQRGSFTLGQRAILGKEDYKCLRKYRDDKKRLKEDWEQLLREMLHFQAPFEENSNIHTRNLEEIQDELNLVESELDAKEREYKQFMEDMSIRGVHVGEVNPGQNVSKEEENTEELKAPKSKTLLKSTFIFAIYFGIEAFTYFTQYDSLKDVKSIEDIAARGIAMFILVGTFHLVSHINRKKAKPIYLAYLITNLIMIGMTMFMPVILNVFYPEAVVETLSAWSVDQSVNVDAVATASNSPAWVELYRKMEWSPTSLSIIFFLVVFFVVPNPMFGEEDTSEDGDDPERPVDGAPELEPTLGGPTNDVPEMAISAWSVSNECDTLKKAVSKLEAKRVQLVNRKKDMESNASDILPMHQKQSTLREQVLEIESNIKEIETKIEEVLVSVDNDLKNYRAEYEVQLASDEIKSSFISPEWITINDVMNHFRIDSK